MPTDKDFKRLVRARMAKTRESYTAARAALMPKQPAKAAPAEAAPDYARLAAMADATIKAKTGCTWERWVRALDHAGAREWPHREIAAYVHEKYEIPGWWAQAVTVGYERIKGLRAIGQRRGGTWEASRSRTFPVAVSRLFAAFRNARTRKRWLGDVAPTIRTSKPDRTMRITWPDNTSVEVSFAGTAAARSRVTVQHRKLADAQAVARTKAFWGERFDALREVLQDH